MTVGNPFWGLVGKDFIRALLANISCGFAIGAGAVRVHRNACNWNASENAGLCISLFF